MTWQEMKSTDLQKAYKHAIKLNPPKFIVIPDPESKEEQKRRKSIQKFIMRLFQ